MSASFAFDPFSPPLLSHSFRLVERPMLMKNVFLTPNSSQTRMMRGRPSVMQAR